MVMIKDSDHDYHYDWSAISHCISYLKNVLNWNKRFNWNCDHDYYDDWSAIMMIGFWLELGHHWCSGCLVSRIRLAHIHQNIYIIFIHILFIIILIRPAHIHPKTKLKWKYKIQEEKYQTGAYSSQDKGRNILTKWPGWQKLCGGTGGPRQKVWTLVKSDFAVVFF